jgi:hypothetical protein
MRVCNVKIRLFVLGLATLVGGSTLYAQDIINLKTNNMHMYNDADTASRQLRYSHNFQSGIAALDNYLDMKILDCAGKKMKKSAIRATLADNPEALRKYNAGVRLYTTAAVLGITSLGILAVRLSQPEHKYAWLAAGIACSTGVVICRITGTAKLKSAINVHNEAKANRFSSILFPELRGTRLGWIGQTVLIQPRSLNFGVASAGGVGLALTF